MTYSVKYEKNFGDDDSIPIFVFQVFEETEENGNDVNNLYTKTIISNPYKYSKTEWIDFINEKLKYNLEFGKDSLLVLDISEVGILRICSFILGTKEESTTFTYIPISKIKENLLKVIEDAVKDGMWY